MNRRRPLQGRIMKGARWATPRSWRLSLILVLTHAAAWILFDEAARKALVTLYHVHQVYDRRMFDARLPHPAYNGGAAGLTRHVGQGPIAHATALRSPRAPNSYELGVRECNSSRHNQVSQVSNTKRA